MAILRNARGAQAAQAARNAQAMRAVQTTQTTQAKLVKGQQQRITRPKTMREISAEKKKEAGVITVSNISRQMIPIHLNPPIVNGKKLDFYVGAQDIHLKIGQTFTFRKDRIRRPQLDRLKKMGKISIISETSPVDAKQKSIIRT
jgi:hypothetical protein